MQQEAASILDTFDFFAANATYQDELLLKGFDSRLLGPRRVSDSRLEFDDDQMMDDLETGEEPGGHPVSGLFFDLVAGDLEAMQEPVKEASERISSTRAGAGALMNRNETTIRQWMSELEATTAN
ncbi:MAG: hypothetical protein KJZ65_08700 [Phycisphaerales bacterium]|nr:hypothetical protein [Phycisphaerales bacterium]